MKLSTQTRDAALLRLAEEVFGDGAGCSSAPAFHPDAPWGPPTTLFLAPAQARLLVDVREPPKTRARRAKKR